MSNYPFSIPNQVHWTTPDDDGRLDDPGAIRDHALQPSKTTIGCMMVAAVYYLAVSMFNKLKIAQKGMVLVVIPAIFALVLVAAVGKTLLDGAQQLQDLQHCKQSLLEVHRLQGIGNSTVQEFYNDTLTPNEKADRIRNLLPTFVTEKDSFGQISASKNPEFAELLTSHRGLRGHLIRLLKKGEKAYRTSKQAVDEFNKELKAESMLSFLYETEDLDRRFLAIEDEMVGQEPHEAKAFQDRLLLVVGFCALCNLIASALLMKFFTKDIVSRLQAIAQKTQLIAVRKPLPAADPADDEIGELDRVISDAGLTLDDARLRESAIFDGTAHVVCSLDSKLKIQTIGDACRKDWCYDPDQLLGKSLLSLIAPSQVDETRHAFDQIAGQLKEGRVETILRCGDATEKNMLWNVHWRNNSFYCVVQDVTEQRAIEQLRQHFFSMASHDLRSPLTAVGMNLQLIEAGSKGAVSTEVRKELRSIEDNLNQLMSLVNEVLALEKIEAAKTTLTLSAVSAEDVCEAARENIAELAAEHRVAIIGPTGSALLLADEAQLELAVTNLLTGVIKLCRPGSKIYLYVKRLSNMGFIEVNQNGYDIPPHEADLIFDKMRQTSIESDRPVKRVGLGFALVKAIADLHGGSVGVDSNMKRTLNGIATGAPAGNTIWLGIPLHSEDSPL